MCAAVVEHVTIEGAVGAERRRILDTLLEDLGALTERGVAALRAEIPHLVDDRHFHPDIEVAIRMVSSGAVIRAAAATALPGIAP